MSADSIFFPRNFNDATALLSEARHYIAHIVAIDQRGLDGAQRLAVSYETLRITARLTQAMAWLMLQRAVYEGELPVEDLDDPVYALAGGAVCEDDGADDVAFLPPKLRTLLDRSLQLYQRIERLDWMVRGASA